MFKSLFSPDNPLMITMSQITDCIFLSLFWLLGCFPIVTMGTSFAAMYDATFRALRKGDKHSWQRFWQVYRSNWKAGIVPSVLGLAAFWAIAKGLISLWNAAVAGSISWMLFSGGALVGSTLLGMLSILYPMLSRFENTTGALMKNTVLLALANMPRTMVLGILNAVSVLLCLRYVFPLFFLPSLVSLIGSLLIEPMFKPYMPDEDAA